MTFIVEVLDTTIGDTGPTQTMDANYLKDDVRDGGTRMIFTIGSGDTVAIQGKAETADSFVTLQSVTSTSIVDVKLPPIWQAKRTVDGGSADSTVKLVNSNNFAFSAHTA
jgi:hypothetical protein